MHLFLFWQTMPSGLGMAGWGMTAGSGAATAIMRIFYASWSPKEIRQPLAGELGANDATA